MPVAGTRFAASMPVLGREDGEVEAMSLDENNVNLKLKGNCRNGKGVFGWAEGRRIGEFCGRVDNWR